MEQDISRVLISRDRIRQRVSELAADISRTYSDCRDGLIIVPVLSGSIIFVADLMRCLPIKMKIGLLTVSRYRGATTTGGSTEIVQDLNEDIAGRHVLILDDILDSGTTLRAVMGQLGERRPASMRTCVLLRKPNRAPKDLNADFVGFDIEDSFVVGYGLDYDGHYRNLPDIAVLRPELYA